MRDVMVGTGHGEAQGGGGCRALVILWELLVNTGRLEVGGLLNVATVAGTIGGVPFGVIERHLPDATTALRNEQPSRFAVIGW